MFISISLIFSTGAFGLGLGVGHCDALRSEPYLPGVLWESNAFVQRSPRSALGIVAAVIISIAGDEVQGVNVILRVSQGVRLMAQKDGAAAQNSSDEREGAEIVSGAEALSKFVAVLQKFGFPAGMFPLPRLDEFGFVEKTGFFWIKHPGRHEHLFPLANEVVVYMQDVSGRIHKGKITALKGWKMKPLDQKELFLSASATEVWLDDPPSGKIHFHIARKASSSKASTAVMESFPLDMFAAAAAQ